MWSLGVGVGVGVGLWVITGVGAGVGVGHFDSDSATLEYERWINPLKNFPRSFQILGIVWDKKFYVRFY